MITSRQVEGDLQYIRDVVRRSEQGMPAGVHLLWAVLTLFGFALVDFAPGSVAWYWIVAAPAGAAISMYLGRRDAVQRGERQRELAVQYASHWMGTLVAIGLVVPLALTGALTSSGLAAAILLLLAASYWQAGVHLDPPLRWVSLIMAAGYLGVLYLSTYVWTAVGIVVAAALAIVALSGFRTSAAAAD